MAIGGGLGGSVIVAPETTYGTWVAPTRAVEVHDAKLQERKHRFQGTGLAAGRSIDLGSRRGNVWSDGGGTLDMEFLNTGQALFLAHAMGSSATLAQMGTTSAYQLVTNYGTPDNQNYFSLQSLVPDTGGVLHQENYHGCKIVKATWTIDVANPLMVSYDIDAQQVTTAEGQASPSFPSASKNFSANGMTFAAGALGSEAFVDGVKKFDLSIERILKVDRMYVGGTTKDEPITIGVTKIAGSFDLDLLPTNKAILWDLYHSDAAVPSILATFAGSAIGVSGHNDTFTLNATDVFIDQNGTPELDGPDVVSATVQFVGLIDSANDAALKSTLITADTGF